MALNALITRRTIRQYQPDYKIPTYVLKAIIDAALLSPSGHNVQDIDLLAVTNREKIEQVTKITLDTIEEEGRKKYLKRIKNFKVKNPITGDAGCLVCLLKNERWTPERIQVHEGIMEMALMVGAREFGLDSMVLGCMKQGDRAAMEKVLGIEPGRLICGVIIGKAVDKPFFIPKKSLAKATYLE